MSYGFYGSSKESSSESELSSSAFSSSIGSSEIGGELSSSESELSSSAFSSSIGSSEIGGELSSSSSESSSEVAAEVYSYSVIAQVEVYYTEGSWAPVSMMRGNATGYPVVENNADFAGGLLCVWDEVPGALWSTIGGSFGENNGFSFEWDGSVSGQTRREARLLVTNTGTVDISIDGSVSGQTRREARLLVTNTGTVDISIDGVTLAPGFTETILSEEESYPFSHMGRGFNVARA